MIYEKIGLYKVAFGGDDMFRYVTGNLLESDADCLINTVNCEGYMGKGIAYQFKLRFPENNKDYIKACKNGTLTIGKLHYFKEDGKTIVNFPTKDKWRNKSEMIYIENGLDELVNLIPKLNIQKIAIPPLGCGNGGLNWSEVKKMISDKLSSVEEKYDFIIFEPSQNYAATAKTVPQLSLSALVLMSIKIGLNKFNTLRLQKTAYFMNLFLKEEYFKFQKHKYGPYDNSIAIISKNIKEFQNYYNTQNTKEAYDIAYNTIVSNKVDTKFKSLQPALKKAIDYVNEISNDSFLECIATIAFLVQKNYLGSQEDIIKIFKNWSEDKANRFSEGNITEGIEYLINTNILDKTLTGYRII